MLFLLKLQKFVLKFFGIASMVNTWNTIFTQSFPGLAAGALAAAATSTALVPKELGKAAAGASAKSAAQVINTNYSIFQQQN